MSKTELYPNTAINQLLKELEEIQQNLLMIKAAALAYCGTFNDDAPIPSCKSPYSSSETAEYFVYRFLGLDPDAKIEAAMDVICELRSQLDSSKQSNEPRNGNGNRNATIKISIGED